MPTPTDTLTVEDIARIRNFALWEVTNTHTSVSMLIAETVALCDALTAARAEVERLEAQMIDHGFARCVTCRQFSVNYEETSDGPLCLDCDLDMLTPQRDPAGDGVGRDTSFESGDRTVSHVNHSGRDAPQVSGAVCFDLDATTGSVERDRDDAA